MKNIAFILASGSGSRFGSDVPKQFHTLNGQEVLCYSITAISKAKKCDAFFVVCAQNDCKAIFEKYGVETIAGADSRNQSLYNALQHIKKKYTSCQNVFIQEAARPMLTSQLVDDYFSLLNNYDSVITTAHISDSLGKYDQHITLREEFYLIQAPEAFKFNLLYSNFNPKSNISATVQQLPKSSSFFKYFEFKDNLKITYPHDLLQAEYLLKSKEEGVKNHATNY